MLGTERLQLFSTEGIASPGAAEGTKGRKPMIPSPTDIILPELEDPICCTNRLSDKGSEKTPTEDWQSRQDIGDLIGISSLD